MKSNNRFLSFVLCGLTLTTPVLANDCSSEIYRRYNPDKCANQTSTSDKISFGTTAAITGGALALIGGTFAVLGLSSSNNNGTPETTQINTTLPTIPTEYKSMVGGDVDTASLTNTFNTSEYIRNNNQYNNIRVAYSLARGYTGSGSNIAIFDFGRNTWHGGNVAYLSSGLIAPNANVTSYQVADPNGNFYSFSKIGDTINTATSANANIYNFSWEITNVSASQVKNRQHIINLTSRNFVNSLTNAAIQNDAILVWAAGNGYNSESNALAALPLHINELQGHFVNVVAWDSEKQALADFSNQCGITQNYCITAPGVALDTPKTDTPLDGTSFAAPIVSGAIAVIREAFPYMKSSEITQLLFTTARDLGATGVDSVYGHGMLDLERATRPVGATLVPLAGGETIALRTAHISGPIGHKIKSENISFAFIDSFGRAFQTRLNDNIRIQNRGIGYERLTDNNGINVHFGNIELGVRQSNLFRASGILGTDTEQQTTFIGFNNEVHLGRATITPHATIGFSHPTATTESMITGFSRITTASAKISARINNFSLSIGTPETIISGNMYLDTPTGRRTNGEYTYTHHQINLTDTPSIEYNAAYKFITAGFVDNPYGRDEIYAIAHGKIIF
ncbi:MAG: S8 family serine peptidase [Alphaproteobacteria bacterium]|nr:S8 family serine peptidase [Alphaproteobacteria bacterium]